MSTIETITAAIGYLAEHDNKPEIRVYDPASGKPVENPDITDTDMPIVDGRTTGIDYSLHDQGFSLHHQPTPFTDYFDREQVINTYYQDTSAAMKAILGAHEVFVFDHNVRSVTKSAAGQAGVGTPVATVHTDYTDASGPKRAKTVLENAGREDLLGRRLCLVNLWRPIAGPVVDVPLTLCDVNTVSEKELFDTRISFYDADNNTDARHAGHIYSVKYSPDHRWVYFSEMQKEEILLLKCWDSQNTTQHPFVPHTGFVHPHQPDNFTPRESIEARTLVVY